MEVLTRSASPAAAPRALGGERLLLQLDAEHFGLAPRYDAEVLAKGGDWIEAAERWWREEVEG